MNEKERGHRTRAGRLLSNFIRQIAEEETELISHPEHGDIMATKAEALARLIWKKALGYKEEKTDKEGLVQAYHHAPDKQMAGLIFDRMEGRTPMTVGDSDGKMTTAERVSEQGKKRIESAGGVNKDSG